MANLSALQKSMQWRTSVHTSLEPSRFFCNTSSKFHASFASFPEVWNGSLQDVSKNNRLSTSIVASGEFSRRSRKKSQQPKTKDAFSRDSPGPPISAPALAKDLQDQDKGKKEQGISDTDSDEVDKTSRGAQQTVATGGKRNPKKKNIKGIESGLIENRRSKLGSEESEIEKSQEVRANQQVHVIQDVTAAIKKKEAELLEKQKIEKEKAEARKRDLEKLAKENSSVHNKIFFYPVPAKSGSEIEIYFNKSITTLSNEPKVYIMGAFNNWRWNSFTIELQKSEISGDWWTCKLSIPKEVYQIDFVFFNGVEVYENNDKRDFSIVVEGGFDKQSFEDFLLEEKRRELERLSVEEAERERMAAEQQRLENQKAAVEADRAEAKKLVAERREQTRQVLQMAVKSVSGLWYIEPDDFRGGDRVKIYYNRESRPLASSSDIWIHGGYNNWQDALSIVHKLAYDNAEDGDWWSAEVEVPKRAFVLNWVFADGPPGNAKVYDNNNYQDFHATVPESIPEELFWAEEENFLFLKLQQERQKIEDAARRKAEKMQQLKAEMKQKTKKRFLDSQKHIFYTEPMEVQAGKSVTVFYNPANTVLNGKAEVWIRCSFNRWTHRLGPLQPQKMVSVDNSSHLKANGKGSKVMSSTSSSIGNTEQRMETNSDSPLWKYVDVIKPIAGGGAFRWRCRGCDVERKSSYYRVVGHLCGYIGRGVKKCPGKNGVHIPNDTVLKYIEEHEAAEEREGRRAIELGSSSNKSKKAKRMQPPSDVIVQDHPFFNTTMDTDTESIPIVHKRKGPIETSFQNKARDVADIKVGRCLYANGLSFNVVPSPFWKDMLRGANEAPKGYCGPGYEKVRTTLLDDEVQRVENQLKPIRDSWVETGVTIVSDGWKDSRNRPLINVLVVSPKGAMFLKAVDCEGKVKDGPFIADILIEAIEQVGARNVVQVITDNAKNCRAAGLLVESRYPHIFWTPCAVHSLNLMLQKIRNQIEWIKTVYEEAEDIQMFVTNHHMTQSLFRNYSKLELLKVAETRFASHIIVLRQLVQVKDALQGMVISNNWGLWKQKNTERANKIKERLLADSWWERVGYLLKITEPIMSMLRYTDMDRPCLGEIYDGIDSMIEKIKQVINEQEQDPQETFFKQVQKIINERWNKMTTPLYLLAYALTPKYYSSQYCDLPGRFPPYRDMEVSDGYQATFRRIFSDDDIRDVIMDEFIAFVNATGLSNDALRHRFKKHAHGWWYLHGQEFRTLQPLAIKVISQVASSSASEKNWSTYSFIHSVKRNRLQSNKAENLVFVHNNLRLLLHKSDEYKEGETKKWDVDVEIADLDASTVALTIDDFDGFDANSIVDSAADPIGLVKVPLDAYMMDFVFSERGDEHGGLYDNRNGMDYHVPVVGGVLREPPMHIVHVTVEMAPIAKVGGLGDVVTSLSRAVQDLGHSVEIICPKYDCLNYSHVRDLQFRQEFSLGGTQIKVWHGKVEGLSVYFIEPNNGMFWVGSIYGRKDDGQRFEFFCHAALEFLLKSGSNPDIIHCHDWTSAPVAWLFQEEYKHYALANARVVFTIHNLEFGAPLIGRAMAHAHKATTVSYTYAHEVSGHSAIAPHRYKFHGILNGIDPDIWDPFNDQYIPMTYTKENVVQGKRAAKEELQRCLGLKQVDRPLVGIITRLTAQKGVHLIKHAIWRTLDRSGQVVLLGSAPDPRIQNDFNNLAKQLHNTNGDMVRLCLTYDEPLSHLIYAGADFILVPSIFEPCGLTQLTAMRYGSIPVVRKTGGLNDTVFDVDHDKGRAEAEGLKPNGFSFEMPDAAGLDYALNRALSVWYEKRDWFNLLCKQVMEQDWSWNRPALDYMELYYSARK